MRRPSDPDQGFAKSSAALTLVRFFASILLFSVSPLSRYCTSVVPDIGPRPTPWAYSTEKESATTTTAR